jgi:hypothetical protein
MVVSWWTTVEAAAAVAAVLAPTAVLALIPFGKRPVTNRDGLVSTLKCWAHHQKFHLECTGAGVTYRIFAFCILFFLTAI